MSVNTSYSQARANLASLLETVTSDREIVIIERRGREDVAMVAASELSSLLETAHLLRSPANAERLLSALGQALDSKGQKMTAAKLRKRFGPEK
jgi:antitoxin YefM